MTFVTTQLVDGGVLVEGTDSHGNDGTTVLRSETWALVQELKAHTLAQEGFDAEVEEFFKPLTDAAAKFHAELADDDDSVITLSEGVDHVFEVKANKVRLDPDGVVLKLLSEAKHNRLRWVGGHLVALKA